MDVFTGIAKPTVSVKSDCIWKNLMLGTVSIDHVKPSPSIYYVKYIPFSIMLGFM